MIQLFKIVSKLPTDQLAYRSVVEFLRTPIYDQDSIKCDKINARRKTIYRRALRSYVSSHKILPEDLKVGLFVQFVEYDKPEGCGHSVLLKNINHKDGDYWLLGEGLSQYRAVYPADLMARYIKADYQDDARDIIEKFNEDWIDIDL